MDTKRKLFIYDRKEVGILILLGVGVALFAFTLGVHLGKQVVPKTNEVVATHESIEPVDAVKEQNPNRNEIANETKNVPAAVDETLDQTLRDEVAKTGMQIDKPKPLNLPTETKNENAPTGRPEIGSTTATAPAPTRLNGRYTLQVGSYPSRSEVEPVVVRLNEQGLRAEVKEVEIKGKGKWFRLLVGQFPTVAEAEKAGTTYKKESRIGDFVVVRATDSETTKNQ